jgi:deoxyribodipyrimidine photo-lyase
LGSDLIVRIGKPEEEVFRIARKAKSGWVFCNRERTPEEVYVQDALEKNLWSVGQELRYSRGKMLYHTGDLPFPIQHTPDSFAQFRKEVERYVPIREPLPRPQRDLNFLTVDLDAGDIPEVGDFGLERKEIDPRSAIHHRGGETEGLKRLHYYLWETDLIQAYHETRDCLLGGDFSTKFSAWLAQGCLSPKMIYAELKRYENQRGENRSTYELFVSLMRRDYHRFMVKKYGDRVFAEGGMKRDNSQTWEHDWKKFERWTGGETSNAFINANMVELRETGYLSNRGRQNIASYLVNDMGLSWQLGADYLESQLIDYDVCSNWSNWNYMAGLGVDSKEEKVLNVEAQAQKYDSNEEYVDLWLDGKKGRDEEEVFTAGEAGRAPS